MGQKQTEPNKRRKAETAAKRSMSQKQIRARARRNGGIERITSAEQKALLGKPIEQWDIEELARGRPRDKNGNFSGQAPKWITREMHEQSIEMFKKLIRTDMQSLSVRALEVLGDIMDNEDEDDKGKLVVPAATKVDVAKFLIEHLIGKPTQPIEADVSIRLQGILANVMVQPGEMSGYTPSASHRVLEGTVVEDDEEDEDG